MKPFVLHVGLTKTATTTLQNALFNRHPQIAYAGKAVGNQAPRECRCEATATLIERIVWTVDEPIAAQDALRFQQLMAGYCPDARILLASWESLILRDHATFVRMLERLRSAFSNVRLFVTLRNPVQWAPAEYFQVLGGHYRFANRAYFGNRCHLEFDEWCRLLARSKAEDTIFFYYRNIRAAGEILGRGGVEIALFEDFVQSPEDFGVDVCGRFGLDPTPAAALLQGQHLNPRLTEAERALIRATDRSRTRKLLWKMASSGMRKHLLARRASALANRPARLELSADQRREIARLSAPAHRWLIEEYGLDLERHGYPV